MFVSIYFDNIVQKLAAVNKVAPGKTHLALSLVGYDDEISAAMQYVFGSSIICKGLIFHIFTRRCRVR
jgi:chromosome segregation ATPase